MVTSRGRQGTPVNNDHFSTPAIKDSIPGQINGRLMRDNIFVIGIYFILENVNEQIGLLKEQGSVNVTAALR